MSLFDRKNNGIRLKPNILEETTEEFEYNNVTISLLILELSEKLYFGW